VKAPRLRDATVAGSLVILVSLAAACGSTPQTPSPADVSPQSFITGPSTPSPSTASPSAPAASPPPGGIASSDPAASPAVTLDPALLSILPATIEGASVKSEPDSFSEALADPDFVANVGSAAFAIVVDGGDLASGVVAHLRPGVYTDAFYRDWRDSYNQGACSQAGGVVGNAEADLGGRTVHITSCAGGLLVYHAYLPERDVVVSLFSLGDRRFGEQLMRGLQP
jgi:hypothetical protein